MDGHSLCVGAKVLVMVFGVARDKGCGIEGKLFDGLQKLGDMTNVLLLVLVIESAVHSTLHHPQGLGLHGMMVDTVRVRDRDDPVAGPVHQQQRSARQSVYQIHRT
jgi:hypothetical protein